MSKADDIMDMDTRHFFKLADMYDYAKDLESENARFRQSLDKLAKLGNGDAYGNSIGNDIAIRALKGLTDYR